MRRRTRVIDHAHQGVLFHLVALNAPYKPHNSKRLEYTEEIKFVIRGLFSVSFLRRKLNFTTTGFQILVGFMIIVE